MEQSCRFAVRVTGAPARGVYDDSGLARAHSAAIYIDVDGHPTPLKPDLEPMLRRVDRLWALLEERNNFEPAGNRKSARRIFEQTRSSTSRSSRGRCDPPSAASILSGRHEV